MKIVYPAILEPEDGLYNVSFPDLPHCYTCGDDLADALAMGADALAGYLDLCEERGEQVPPPSDLAAVSAPVGCLCVPILADLDAWRRAHSTKAVKKTLTIPQWLNTAAENRGVNFSQVLQDALKKQLGAD